MQRLLSIHGAKNGQGLLLRKHRSACSCGGVEVGTHGRVDVICHLLIVVAAVSVTMFLLLCMLTRSLLGYVCFGPIKSGLVQYLYVV